MMRIGINCRPFLLKTYTGIGRYTFNLVKYLAQVDRENEYWLYVRRGLWDTKRRTPVPPAANFRIKRDFFNTGVSRTLRGADLYHSPCPEDLNVKGMKLVVTVHDLIFKTHPQSHTAAARQAVERQMAGIVDKADKIICCSQATVDDLKALYDVGDERLRLIYQGVDHNIFYPLAPPAREEAVQFLEQKGIRPPFLLFVGTIEPRKNLSNMLKAVALLKAEKKFDGQLVVVGMKGWLMEDLDQQVKELHLKEHCVFLGYVTDDELRCLYNFCEVFVFPSFYEGFGFPIIEAMSCGAAVVASRTSSCGEILADAGLGVNPEESRDIANAVEKVLADEALKTALKQKSIERAKAFSFRNTAEQTLEVYQHVLSA